VSNQRRFPCRVCHTSALATGHTNPVRIREDLCAECFAILFPNERAGIPAKAHIDRQPRSYLDAPHPIDVRRDNAMRRRRREKQRDMEEAPGE
jgi:type II secretory pathway component HofQ